MIPAGVDYRRAASVDEALALLAGTPGAKVIAGGQSLIPVMKLRLAGAPTLVDIGRIGELRGVMELPDGRLRVGALTTYAELLATPVAGYGVMKDALPGIGDVQVRNRGTIGGAVAHADPALDLPACLLALDVAVVLRSPAGERTVPFNGFVTGAFTTSLAPDELVTHVLVPGHRPGVRSAYVSLAQPASGYPMVGVGAVVGRGDDGRITFARIGITGVSDHAYRATGVEDALAGAEPTASVLAAAAAGATDGRNVNSDIHADRAYRTAMAAVYTRRAVEAALARFG